MIHLRLLVFSSVAFYLLANAAQSQTKPILITADLMDAPRKLFHAEIDLPVHAGPLALIHAGIDSGYARSTWSGGEYSWRRIYRRREDAAMASG